MTVTLRQLRYFNALARHGHFGRAAEACAISEPALSMQIKDWRKLWRRAAREKRPASRADEVRTPRDCLGIESLRAVIGRWRRRSPRPHGIWRSWRRRARGRTR